MKNYRITVNGNTYDVAVEELAQGEAVASVPAAPVSAPVPAAKPAAPTASAAPADAYKITSPMPGTILDLKVKQGDTISANQVVAILEAMKMENEIVTPVGGKVVSVNVAKGGAVDTGDLILSIAE